MRILVGSLGRLGFLVKDVTGIGTDGRWAILPDEPSLTSNLSGAFSENELRDALRRVRREGRVILSCEDRQRAVLGGRIPTLA
jgi:hypothetical protein